MANSAFKPCNKHGCPNLTKEKFCPDHKDLDKTKRIFNKEKAREYDRQRGTAAERGYDHSWRKYREQFLKRNPKCVMCGAKATVCDHILPHKGNKILFNARFNHQALCRPCHDRKTRQHDMGAW